MWSFQITLGQGVSLSFREYWNNMRYRICMLEELYLDEE